MGLKSARKIVNKIQVDYRQTTTADAGVRETQQADLVEKNREAGGFGSLNAVLLLPLAVELGELAGIIKATLRRTD